MEKDKIKELERIIFKLARDKTLEDKETIGEIIENKSL